MQSYPPKIELTFFPRERRLKKQIDPSKFAGVQVLYHSVALQAIAWLDLYKALTRRPDGNHPGSDDKRLEMQWIQYKLNELGYQAGPITGEKNEQTRLALQCYGYTVDDLEESDDEAQKGLLDALKGNEGARPSPLDARAALTDRGTPSRLLLDPGHGLLRGAWIGGPDLPVQVTADLVSKDDKDGKGKGVHVPAAVGPVRCEWHIVPRDSDDLADEPRAVEHIGEHPDKPLILRIKGGEYLQRVVLSEGLSAQLEPSDALPFRPTGLLHRLPDRTGDVTFVTQFNVDARSKARRPLLGTSVAVLHGAYTGPENFAVEARLSFAGAAGAGELEGAHKALRALRHSFGAHDPEKDRLIARTGTLSRWRRDWVTTALGEAGWIRTRAKTKLDAGGDITVIAGDLTRRVSRWSKSLFDLFLRKRKDVPDFAVLALGSFARGEMAPRSDMDLVYIRRNEDRNALEEIRKLFAGKVASWVSGKEGGFQLDDVTGSTFTPEEFVKSPGVRPQDTALLHGSSKKGEGFYQEFLTLYREQCKKEMLLGKLNRDRDDRRYVIEKNFMKPDRSDVQINVKTVLNFFCFPISNATYYLEFLSKGEDQLGRTTLDRLAKLREADLDFAVETEADFKRVLGLRYELHFRTEKESDVLLSNEVDWEVIGPLFERFAAYSKVLEDFHTKESRA